MASLLRFLGLAATELGSAAADEAETDTVRRIASQLEQLDSETAKYLAAFAYVLARVAHADLEIDAHETQRMQEIVSELASLAPQQAALAVEIAKSQTRLLGGTENYVVTREFKKIASPEQRAELLGCLFAVAAADGSISGSETAEINKIAEELGFTRAETNAVRAQYRDKLSVLQKGS